MFSVIYNLLWIQHIFDVLCSCKCGIVPDQVAYSVPTFLSTYRSLLQALLALQIVLFSP